MPGFRSIPWVLACTLPLSAAAQKADHTDQDSQFLKIDIEGLRAEIQEILDEDSIPGASVALVETDRTIWAGGVGKADVAAGVNVTADHLFRIGSISKSFTALAVLRAVEAGLVDLETPIREVAPDLEFANRWEETHPITLATLMEHTTGFDGPHWLEMAVNDPEITLAQGLALHPHSRVSRWRPGTHMAYNNSGPAMAAFVLEAITGRVFEDYVREHVLEPLGMASSTFRIPKDTTLMAKGYEADGASEAHYDHIAFKPSGAMNASAYEMARYLRMMINRGTLDGVRLLAPETISRIETPTTTLAARKGFKWGDGLGVTTYIVGGHLFHGHGGTITGFKSRSGYSSDLGVGFFVSINKESYRIEDIGRLLGERLTEGFEKPESAVASLSDDQL
ncbi:MAG: serine hydrolase [Holophagales bacterium]|nr:serine hydrolase [Holophagales bacterium]MYC10769.1 serine hydrolase [Holophagales bacterium]